MKSILRTALVLLLCLTLYLCLIPAAYADNVASGDWGLHWTLDDTGLLTIYGKGQMADFDDSTDTGAWRAYQSQITEAVIVPGVTSIGSWAFSGCFMLTIVTIPDSVTSIGEVGFSGCMSLTGVTIPEGVTSIGDYTFSYCFSLESVTIPTSVTSIGEEAFSECESLSVVWYAGTKAQWEAIAIEEGNEPLRSATIHYGYELVPDFILPASLTTIETEAFAGGAFTCVQLPEVTTVIGSRAFAGCPNLSYIYIPGATETIAEDAFSGVSGLTILGRSDSYAKTYAQQNGILFVAVE